MSIWCPGSSERIYLAVKAAPCPHCGKVVELTQQGHIKPHVELKIGIVVEGKMAHDQR